VQDIHLLLPNIPTEASEGKDGGRFLVLVLVNISLMPTGVCSNSCNRFPSGNFRYQSLKIKSGVV